MKVTVKIRFVSESKDDLIFEEIDDFTTIQPLKNLIIKSLEAGPSNAREPNAKKNIACIRLIGGGRIIEDHETIASIIRPFLHQDNMESQLDHSLTLHCIQSLANSSDASTVVPAPPRLIGFDRLTEIGKAIDFIDYFP